jgi:homoserine kinase
VRVTVRAPATAANLGPGFDCIGLALELVNEVTVDTDAEPGVSWEGEGANELPVDGTDLVSRSMRAAAEELGRELPPVSMRATNRIPLERGLGSSAAAAVAGAAIGNAFAGVPSVDEPFASFDVAARLEGHPDNAAAAAFGGVAIVVDGVPLRIDPHPELRPVLLVPSDVRISTAESRRSLPDPIARADAVAQLGHVAALTVALATDPRLMPLAMNDRLHEDARLAHAPAVRELRDRLREASVPVCLSGAGPALLAFEDDDVTVPDPPDGWRVLRPGVRTTGVEIDVEP